MGGGGQLAQGIQLYLLCWHGATLKLRLQELDCDATYDCHVYSPLVFCSNGSIAYGWQHPEGEGHGYCMYRYACGPLEPVCD